MKTTNLLIIACTEDILKAAIEGDNILSQKLNISVEPGWTEFGAAALQYSLNKILEGEGEMGWWTFFPIHIKDNRLIGSGGYKGKPNDGVVEIGYEICNEYRNRGLATEMAAALIENAFNHQEVNLITAHTLGELNASTKVLQKIGFIKTAEINDPDDGLLWKWELKRS